MTADDAFLQAILADPSDDTLRLIFADALEERGDGARAEFIRAQVELSRCRDGHESCPPDSRCGRYYACVRRSRERALLGRTDNMTTRQLFEPEYSWLPEPIRYLFETGPRDGRHDRFWEWRRGFVAVVTLTTQAFLDHAAELFRAAPIEEIKLSDKRPSLTLNGLFCWAVEEDPTAPPWRIPECLAWYLDPKPPQLGYESLAEALAALSRACIAYGRQLAGLPVYGESPLRHVYLMHRVFADNLDDPSRTAP